MTSWILAYVRHLDRAAMRLGDDECGVTMLEYCLIGALIAAVCAGAVATVGPQVSDIFNNVATPVIPHP
jgi:Flp pilus assembly pilin Flp